MASKLLRAGYNCLKSGVQIRHASNSGVVSVSFLQELTEEKDDEKFNQHFINYFSRPEIDHWELRKGLTELHMMDAVPDPKVAEAAFRACRRVNDFALCIRFLESIKYKCKAGIFMRNEKELYEYMIKELKPVMDELGINTIEELGYDKPELFTPDPGFYWEDKWYKEYGYDKLPAYKSVKMT